jgi:hypothetical protein
MKKSATFAIYAAALGLFAACGGLSDAFAQVKPGKAKVTTAGEGSRYSTTKDVWVPIQAGDSIPEGAVIATASKYTDLLLDGSIVRVQPNTTLKLDKLSGGSAAGVKVIDTQLNLADGRVSANIRKLAAGARYEVKTPGGVAGIRGSKLDVQTYFINGKRLTIYSAVDGTADVAETTPKGVVSLVLNKGESFITGDFAPGETVNIPGIGQVTVSDKPIPTPVGFVPSGSLPNETGPGNLGGGAPAIPSPEDNTSSTVPTGSTTTSTPPPTTD